MATTTNIQPTMGKEVTVHDIFQKTLDKTTHWLKDIKNECNLTDIHQAYTLLRAVLFTIRDRAPMSDMVHFSAQLPMLVRGFFFEGWVPYDTPDKEIKTKQNFFDTVALHVGNRPGVLTEDIERKTMGVLKVLNKYVTSAEMKKLENIMPHNLKELFSGQAFSSAQTTTQATI
jgi:uncharacterized protein (DUF2267 family)